MSELNPAPVAGFFLPIHRKVVLICLSPTCYFAGCVFLNVISIGWFFSFYSARQFCWQKQNHGRVSGVMPAGPTL